MTLFSGKKRIFVGLFFLSLVLLAGWVVNRYVNEYTSDFLDHTLYSSVMKESRKVFVRLPHHYDPEKAYPLIIRTDGNFNLKRWDASLADFAQATNNDDAILVSIPNHYLKDTRNRDLVPPYARRNVMIEPRPDNEKEPPEFGQADVFLTFIETELLPYIEDHYRISDNRVLSGFSAGGSLVLYAMVTKPDLFTGYFAFSPAAWYDDSVVVKEFKKHLVNSEGASKFLYLSLGGAENDIITGAFHGLAEALKTRAPENLVWSVNFSEGAGHVDNPYISVPKAISAYANFREQMY
ncbi:alpha/beta hydrolase [Colwelliaceae bacterium 6441]